MRFIEARGQTRRLSFRALPCKGRIAAAGGGCDRRAGSRVSFAAGNVKKIKLICLTALPLLPWAPGIARAQPAVEEAPPPASPPGATAAGATAEATRDVEFSA